jgi:hypothetical protein
VHTYVKGKVNPSNYSPGQSLRFPGSWGSQTSRQSAGDKVVSAKHRPSLPQELFLVLISVTGWVNLRAIVRPEGLCQLKIPVTPSGIEPAIFRLVEQCPNQLRHRVPSAYSCSPYNDSLIAVGMWPISDTFALCARKCKFSLSGSNKNMCVVRIWIKSYF